MDDVQNINHYYTLHLRMWGWLLGTAFRVKVAKHVKYLASSNKITLFDYWGKKSSQ